MNTFITITSIILFLIAAYVAIMLQHDKQFRRFVKVDDPIKFKYNGKTHFGRVKLVGRRYLHLQTERLNGKPITRKILFKDTNPVFWFRYRKNFD